MSGTPWERRVHALARESPRAYLIALRILGSPALAEEAVQEAYSKLLQHPRKDEGHSPAALYLFKTVRGTAIDLSRSMRSRKSREDEYAMKRNYEFLPPDETVQASELARAARSAMSELPLEEREAVSLCCEQELSRAAASQILNVPERTVSHRVQRGLDRLRSHLAAQGFAAITPLALGQGLRYANLPAAPSGLAHAVSTVKKVARFKSAHAGVTAGAKATAGAILATAVVLATVYGTRSSPVRSTPSTLPAASVPAPAAAAANTPDRLARFDFEDGQARPEWVGKIELGPPRPASRRCLAGQTDPEQHVTRAMIGNNDVGIFTYRDGATLSFDYFVDNKVELLDVFLWNRSQAMSFGGFKLKMLERNTWAHATVDLAQLGAGGNHMRDGDLVIDLTIQTNEQGGVVFVDNIDVASPKKK